MFEPSEKDKIDIINKIIQGNNMEDEPMTNNVPSYQPQKSPNQYETVNDNKLSSNIPMKRNSKNHICNCGKKLSNYYSLWRHRKICKNKQDPTPAAKIQSSELEKKSENDVTPIEIEPKSHLLTRGKENFESDSQSEESLQESDYDCKSDQEELEAFRNLYLEFHHNLGMYSKLVRILDRLEMMDCMTKEECNVVKEHLQKEIGFSEDDKVDDPEDIKDKFINLHNELKHNIEVYNKLVLMLDEMKNTNFLTKEECSFMKKNIEKKLAL